MQKLIYISFIFNGPKHARNFPCKHTTFCVEPMPEYNWGTYPGPGAPSSLPRGL